MTSCHRIDLSRLFKNYDIYEKVLAQSVWPLTQMLFGLVTQSSSGQLCDKPKYYEATAQSLSDSFVSVILLMILDHETTNKHFQMFLVFKE